MYRDLPASSQFTQFNSAYYAVSLMRITNIRALINWFLGVLVGIVYSNVGVAIKVRGMLCLPSDHHISFYFTNELRRYQTSAKDTRSHKLHSRHGS